jgi:hypothetical protein
MSFGHTDICGVFRGRFPAVRPNIKRGLNRIFIASACIWAIYCLVLYPFQKRIEAVRKHDSNMTDCYRGPYDEQKDCYAAVQQIFLNEVEQYQMPEYYKWSWPFLLVSVLGLPIVLYVFFYSVIATFLWVSRGFKSA